MGQQTIRPYIMALYSLQDEFRTLLGAPNVEGLGRTFDNEMALKDDGTQELKFSIPMYIRENGELKENPAWYTYADGNLIVGMRKIKVIFGSFPNEDRSPLETMIVSSVDKTRTLILDGVKLIYSSVDKTDDELYKDRLAPTRNGGAVLMLSNNGTDTKIFEFVITKITEEHKEGILTCNVEAEGLAFQELGKTGYKLSLNQDSYDIDYKAYQDGIIAQVSPFYSYAGAQIDEKDTSGYSLDLTFKEIDKTINDANSESLYKSCDEIEVNLKIDVDSIIQSDQKYKLNFYCTENLNSSIKWEFAGKRYPLGEVNTVEDITLEDEDIQYITIKFIKNGASIVNVPVVSSFSLKQQDEVKANIDYWMDKVVEGTDWEYEVQTDWSTYDGELERNYDKLSDYSKSLICKNRELRGLRRMDKMYEDEYVSSWNDDGSPMAYEKVKEKERIIDSNESNRYNITQDIAEKFEVYCKYVYSYDNYFRITGRRIVFFNNYIKNKDIIDITYPFDTSEISRELDCTDIVTKMYVKSIDDDTNLNTGKISIADSPSNKSKEDYILNFDYMYDIGSITQDQYDEVKKYEEEIRVYNIELERLSNSRTLYSNALAKEEGNVTYYKNAAIEANEQVKEANRGIEAILGEDREVNACAYQCTVLTDSDGNYVNIYKSGIKTPTLKIYSERDDDLYYVSEEESESEIGIKKIVPVSEELTKVYLSSAVDDDTSVLYAYFTYSPYLYYSEIVRKYSEIFKEAQNKRTIAEERVTLYKENVESCEIQISIKKKEKAKRVAKFEKYMGTAVREGNWQDDKYKDLGNKYTKTLNLTSSDFVLGSSKLGEKIRSASNESFYCLDDVSFDDEQKSYLEYGENKTKMYYPYIIIEPSSFKDYSNLYLSYKDYWKREEVGTILSEDLKWDKNKTYSKNDVCYVGTSRFVKYTSLINNNKGYEPGLNTTSYYYGIGSQLVPAILQIDGQAKTVLLITDEKLIKEQPYEFTPYWDYSELTECARFVKIKSKLITNSDDTTSWGYETEELTEKLSSATASSDNIVIIHEGSEDNKILFPRIKIKNMLIKVGEQQIWAGSDTIGSKLLEEFVDYSELPRYASIENPNDEAYCFTINPLVYLKHGISLDDTPFTISYTISNACTSVYLDAKKVSKENAYPKVSYEVTINAINKTLISTLYDRLYQICHINDAELKFQNVKGYISEIEMKLDEPWEDEVTIKNYKSKFEDLFSSIVASTEQMKANGTAYERAANCFLTTGELKEETIANSIASNTISYDFDKGNLTISEENGIWAISEDGVVAMRGGGISIANEKDASGDWLWHTGITPNGINASVINAGQLNLEKIFIYAGDNVAYQMNSSGLYAYKQKGDEFLTSEYVVHNGDGLFLVNKAGEHTYTDEDGNSETLTLSKDINRVEVSWNGLIIRNTNDEKVFYADTEGNLTLSGVINAKAGNVGDWMIYEGGLATRDLSAGIVPGNKGGNVLWVSGDDNYFAVDSDGIVTATSLILQGSMLADEATVNGVPLTAVIAQVGIGEGIFYTPLLGNVFSKDNDLKYAITKYRVDIEYDDMIDKIVVQAKSKNEEDEDIYIDIDSSCYDIEFDGGNYLTIILHRSIMNEAESGVFRFAMDYDGNEYATSDLELSMISDGEAYTVYIESDSGNILRNYEGSEINLTARVYLNGEEVKEDKFTYKWFKNKDEIKDKWIKNGSEVEEGTEDAEKVNNHAKTISINELDIYSCEVEVN